MTVDPEPSGKEGEIVFFIACYCSFPINQFLVTSALWLLSRHLQPNAKAHSWPLRMPCTYHLHSA